jgi:hypothetical protein
MLDSKGGGATRAEVCFSVFQADPRAHTIRVTVIGGIGNLRASDFYLPMEIRADISTAPTANLARENLAREPRLEIGEWGVIGDQQAANASGAHFSKADLRRASRFGHVRLKRGPGRQLAGGVPVAR